MSGRAREPVSQRPGAAPPSRSGSVSRRGFLGLLGCAAGAALAGCGSGPGAGQTGEQLRSGVPLPAPFRVPLPVPPVARPVGRDAAGAELYTVTQRVAQVEILPGVRTPILGYDGIFPGPTIETRRDRPIVVRHRNELPVPTVVHLHGGHTAPEHDGWPSDLVLPLGDTAGWTGHRMVGDVVAGERAYHYPGRQRAATLWYHDHRMDFTGPAMYRGLVGLHHWAAPRPGGSSPTCTIPCTCTSTRSRCCAGAAAGRDRWTAGGRTPSICGRPRWWTSRSASPTTPGGSCCTATTSSTRTWP